MRDSQGKSLSFAEHRYGSDLSGRTSEEQIENLARGIGCENCGNTDRLRFEKTVKGVLRSFAWCGNAGCQRALRTVADSYAGWRAGKTGRAIGL